MKRKILLICLALIFMLTGCTKGLEHNKKNAIRLESKIKATIETAPITIASGDIFYEAEGNIVKARTADGKTQMRHEMQAKITDLEKCRENVLVHTGTELACISVKGEVLWNEKVDENLIGVYTDQSGNTLLEKNNGSGSTIQIIDRKGKKDKSLKLKNAYVLGFYERGSEFLVSLIDTSKENIRSKLILMNDDGEINWAYNIDGKIITKIMRGYRDAILMTDDESIYSCRVEREPQPDIVHTNGELLGFSATEKNVAAAVLKKGEFVLQIYNYKLSLKKEIKIKYQPDFLRLNDDYIAVVKNDKVFIYNLEGQSLGEYQCVSAIKNVEFIDDNVMMISTASTLEKVIIE